MKTKTLLNKSLKSGGHFEIAVGYYEPCFRNKKKRARQYIILDILPTICLSSEDNFIYGKDDEEWTTIHIQWLHIFVYFEVVRPVRGTAEKW